MTAPPINYKTTCIMSMNRFESYVKDTLAGPRQETNNQQLLEDLNTSRELHGVGDLPVQLWGEEEATTCSEFLEYSSQFTATDPVRGKRLGEVLLGLGKDILARQSTTSESSTKPEESERKFDQGFPIGYTKQSPGRGRAEKLSESFVLPEKDVVLCHNGLVRKVVRVRERAQESRRGNGPIFVLSKKVKPLEVVGIEHAKPLVEEIKIGSWATSLIRPGNYQFCFKPKVVVATWVDGLSRSQHLYETLKGYALELS